MTLKYLTAGESHGPALTAILEGLPAGLPINEAIIQTQLSRRQKGSGSGPRMKLERDHASILSGVMGGLTTGAPLTLQIINRDHENWLGKEIAPYTTPRPGHADLTAAVKYGYRDLRPALERASARETAARVAVGAICRHLLEQFDVLIGGYILSIGSYQADLENISYKDRFNLAEKSEVRCPDPAAEQQILSRIGEITEEGDTLGGVIEVAVLGLPIGLGSHAHWDRRLDSRLGAAVLGVQAMKGVEIGPAFENSTLPGSQIHDAIHLDGDNLVRHTNRAGGLEGGITNGQPLLVRAAMKPIATTLTPQKTVNLASGKEEPTCYERSDFCPTPRAVPVLEAVVAIVVANALIEKLGGDSLSEMQSHHKTLRHAARSELQMDNNDQIWWPE